MTYFTGYCIGGPLAGQIITSQGPTRQAIARRPMSVMDFYPTVPEPEFKTVTYFHVSGPRNFFTAGKRMTQDEILEALTEGYTERADIERCRRRDPALNYCVKRALEEAE